MPRVDPPTESPSFVDRALDAVLEAALGLAIRLAEWLGSEATLRLGAAFGRTWWALRGPRTGRVVAQLEAAFPEDAPDRVRAHARNVFVHLGQGLAEGLLLSGRHRAQLLDAMEVDGLEHLAAARAAAGGRGALLVAPHLGSWELAGAKLAALGVPLVAVYRSPRRVSLDRALRRLRRGSAGADADPDPDGGAQFEQIAMGPRAGVQFVWALRGGRNVVALLDQRARAEEGPLVRFFGRPARVRSAPIKLAARAGAPVLVAVARRSADRRRHRLTIQPALQLESSPSDEDGEKLERDLQRVTEELEKAIRASPGQWIWTHRRWRGPPDRADAS